MALDEARKEEELEVQPQLPTTYDEILKQEDIDDMRRLPDIVRDQIQEEEDTDILKITHEYVRSLVNIKANKRKLERIKVQIGFWSPWVEWLVHVARPTQCG